MKEQVKSTTRLYVPHPSLGPGQELELSANQGNYLRNVLRLEQGAPVAVFNGVNGEWQSNIQLLSKKQVVLCITEMRRPQQDVPDIWLTFAPVKSGRIDFIVEKATELGVSKLIPVITQRTIVSRVNTERLQAHAIEAAEQCERLSVPDVTDPVKLPNLLGQWEQNRTLVYGDETGGGNPIMDALKEVSGVQWGFLTGPEGGFTLEELEMLRGFPAALGIGLGPRILRADTAAVAGLTCLLAMHGDWKNAPSFGRNG